MQMIVVTRKLDPNVVFAYHTSGYRNTVAASYPADDYRAFLVPAVSCRVGDAVDTSAAEEIELLA